jgi:hypothetical protein
MPNGLELSCPAEAGNSSLLYARLAGTPTHTYSPARRVSFSELLGSPVLFHRDTSCREKSDARNDMGQKQGRPLLMKARAVLEAMRLSGERPIDVSRSAGWPARTS